MALDRDLNVAVVQALRTLGRPISTGWEMTAATGVRGLRLVHEAPRFARFDLTERHPAAAGVLRENSGRFAADGARAFEQDAIGTPPTPSYEYVDLDPYGSPVDFLPTAIQATSPDGVLAVTATDQRVLAGVERGVALRRYGGRPVHGRLGPESGLRLLLATVDRCARVVGRSTRPLLAYVGEHHVRAYLEIGLDRSSSLPDPVGIVDPTAWAGPSLGDGGPFGPLWLGALHDPTLVGSLKTPETAEEPRRLDRWIDGLREESQVDVPFFYESNTLARDAGLGSPPSRDRIVDALRERGFRAARSPVRDGAFRTDAPRAEVLATARGLVQSQNERVRA